MNRQRLVIGLQLAAGLVLVGLGHYYVASLRDVYPIDGYVLYAVALVMFVLVWRSVRREVDVRWDRLRSALWSAWVALLELLPSMSVRTRVVIVFTLNVLAAIAALWLPAAIWLWLILWVVSIAILLAMIWPQVMSSLRSKVSTPSSAGVAAAPDTRVLIEPAETIGPKPKLIGLGLAVVLLVIGQIVIGSVNRLAPSPADRPSTNILNDTLKLGLPGDPLILVAGGLLLLLGFGVFAWATRRNGLSDAPRFKADAPVAGDSRLGWLWLLVAIAGAVIWLTVPKLIIDGASGWGGVLPWITALVLIGLCWWRIDRARGVRLSIHIDRLEAIGLGLAALAILIVFVFRLGDVPNSLWPDEAAFFSTARDISRGAFTPDFFGLGTYGYPMGGSIYQSIWISLFGANVLAWRLSSVIAALMAIVPIYFLVRATLGRRVAGLSIALYAVSPYLLTYARMGYNNVQAIAPLVLTLVLTWLAVRRNSCLFAFLAGCAGGLGFFTYTAARLGFVLALVGLLWIWITRRASGRSILMQGACLLLGVVLVATPTIVYGSQRYPEIFADKQAEALFNNVFYARDLYPEQDLYASFGSIRVGNQDLFYQPGIYATLLDRGIVRTVLSFNAPALVHANYLVGALSEPYGVFYVLGLGWCLIRLRRPGYALWPAWLLIGAFALSAINTFPPRPEHMLPIVPAMAVLAALGLTIGVDLLASFVNGITDRTKWILLISGVVIMGFFGLRTYFVEMPNRFPPDLENAMFWQAQHLSRGSDITLIQPAGMPDDFVPWGMREFDLGVAFHLIKPADLESVDLRGLCPADCRFFFVADAYQQVMPYLTQSFGNISPVSYVDANGAIQSYAFNPMDHAQ